MAYGESGRHEEARDAFMQAVRVKPDYADAHYNLGVAYGKSGKNKEAIEAFKQTIRFKPDYAEAQYGLGVAYGESGMYEEAREAFKQVIRFKPDYAEAHYNLGIVYVMLKERDSDLDNAVVEMEKAVDLSPESVRFNMELGRLYFSVNRPGDAMERFLTYNEPRSCRCLLLRGEAVSEDEGIRYGLAVCQDGTASGAQGAGLNEKIKRTVRRTTRGPVEGSGK
jgi:tetratricopeptide (TPR) repeat protein